MHEENQPCHLHIKEEDIAEICLKKCTGVRHERLMNDGALESLRRADSNGVIISIPVSRCQSVERILSLVS